MHPRINSAKRCVFREACSEGHRASSEVRDKVYGNIGIVRYCKVLQGKVGQESDWSVGDPLFHFACHSLGPLSDQSDHSICYNYNMVIYHIFSLLGAFRL